jgi:hypothetical protein
MRMPTYNDLIESNKHNKKNLKNSDFKGSPYHFDKLLMIFMRYAFATLFIALSFRVSKTRSSITIRPLMITVRTSEALVA